MADETVLEEADLPRVEYYCHRCRGIKAFFGGVFKQLPNCSHCHIPMRPVADAPTDPAIVGN